MRPRLHWAGGSLRPPGGVLNDSTGNGVFRELLEMIAGRGRR